MTAVVANYKVLLQYNLIAQQADESNISSLLIDFRQLCVSDYRIYVWLQCAILWNIVGVAIVKILCVEAINIYYLIATVFWTEE